MKTFLVIIGGIVVYIATAVLYGFTLSVLWSWFVVKPFHTVALSIPLAIGISMLVTFLTYHYNPRQESEKGDWGKSIAFSVIYSLMVLGMGAIVHAFVA